MTTRHWFITGVSGGIGRAIASAALARGDVVIGSLRRPEQQSAFESLAPGRAHAVLMDVTRPEQIAQAADTWPQVDILVNNAGIGMVGAVEETAADEARRVFEVNFFGLLQVTQAFLPGMRARRSGHIINISSGVGLSGLPGMPLYSASKFAVEGLSEALAGEVAAYGIRVSLIEPGAILSNFVGDAMLEAARRIPDYAPVSGHGRGGLAHYYQQQASTPEQVAAAVLEVADEKQPPLRRLVGADVRGAAENRLQSAQQLLSPDGNAAN